jgi:hypothetical protein
MATAELTTCRVLEDPALSMPAEGYVVSFLSFYQWGFGIPSHRFLRSLLQHYGLELHNLTPSRVLHIAAFVTPCEAYLGIDPEFDLWNYFFRVRHPQDIDVRLVVSGGVITGVIIHVKSCHGVDPYIDIPMPRSIKGWRKKLFYLRNDASTLLHTFTSCRTVPLPS